MPYWSTKTGFQPFNDSANYYGRSVKNSYVSGGINTAPIDQFREGVNLRTFMDIYKATQVKISFTDGQQALTTQPNGRFDHQSTFQTFGQAVDFIQYTGIVSFDDAHKSVEGTRANANNVQLPATVEYLIDNGNIVEGLMDASQVYPIYMNGGPQFMEEAIIEPFPMPFRLNTNESPQELARGIFAFFEDGNYGDERRFGANQVEQMQYRDQPIMVRPYLEYGADFLIVTASGKTQVINIKPTAIPDQTVIAKIKPWVDEPPAKYFPQLLSALDLLSASINNVPFYYNNYSLSDSNLQNRDQKSSTAGYSYYGPNMGYYGTDSIAFGGLLRGS